MAKRGPIVYDEDEQSDEAAEALVDAVTNGFAIIIVLTTLSLLTFSTNPPVKGSVLSATTKAFAQTPRAFEHFRPLTEFFVFRTDGLYRLGFEELAAAHIADPEASTLMVGGRRNFLTGPDGNTRDLNSFRVQVLVQYLDHLVAASVPAESELDEKIAFIEAIPAGSSPWIHVIPDAVPLFAEMYVAMKERDISFRWAVVRGSGGIRISVSRRSANFDNDTFFR
ncbi:hypothetical protein [Sagittula stellata]|uniref:Uncharacterized protein n=1 Tax=Sagittula stellata (strain ATCC 700073 / DSM 11524 / E-37) TaxID=388399 RepID=A3K4L2_SAGS3|nr:hypothetical protein [Sagittula stellata]EBA07911.1 hypothetical protein SSE37_01620 [Sagittula stellata E-37]